MSEHNFTEATTSLAPHPTVTLDSQNGLPTLHVWHPLDIELNIESADPTESYKPLGVLFEQQGKTLVKMDHDGSVNFTQRQSDNGTVIISNKYIHHGAQGHYEFFVVIQRASDGAMGIIDPGMNNEPQE